MTKLVAPVEDGEVGQFKIKPPLSCRDRALKNIKKVMVFLIFFAIGFSCGFLYGLM